MEAVATPTAGEATRSRRVRRVRTARSRFVEFFLVPDAMWAAVLSLIATPIAAFTVSLDLGSALAFFFGALLCLFLVFWAALINCNPYPWHCCVFDHLRVLDRALPTQPVTRSTDLASLAYPLVFKPSLCSTNSSGVRLIHSAIEAAAYMRETLEDVVCAQAFHPGEEYTIMWERWPWSRRGRVVAVCWRRKTHPAGEFHPLSGNGTPKVTVPASHLSTPALVRVVETMMVKMPSVYCTRFDVRADGEAAMSRGDFWVLESNGTVGVPARSTAYSSFVHTRNASDRPVQHPHAPRRERPSSRPGAAPPSLLDAALGLRVATDSSAAAERARLSRIAAADRHLPLRPERQIP